jgi:hypothetical protein
MVKAALACIALVIAGALATTGAASAPAPSHPAEVAHFVTKTPKCLKFAKKHGKKVCVKRAKAKPKPKPTGGGDGGTTTTPTPTPTPTAISGTYTGVSAQNASLQFDLHDGTLGSMTVGEIDSTCNPGGWEYALFGTFPVGRSLDDAGKLHASIPVQTSSGDSGTLVVDVTVDTTGRATGSLVLTMNVNDTGGPYTCSSGTVAWNAGTGASAPPAPQHAKPGHYAGTTAQGAAFVFDVAASGSVLVMKNLTFPELDEDCDPGQVHVALKDFNFSGSSFFIDAAGSMRAFYRASDADFSRTFSITGSIGSNGQASGTINDQEAFPYGGTNWTCASGAVGWSATLQ